MSFFNRSNTSHPQVAPMSTDLLTAIGQIEVSGLKWDPNAKPAGVGNNVCKSPGIYAMKLVDAKFHTSKSNGNHGILYTYEFTQGTFQGLPHTSFDRNDPSSDPPNFFLLRNLDRMNAKGNSIAEMLEDLKTRKPEFKVSLTAAISKTTGETYLNPFILGTINHATAINTNGEDTSEGAGPSPEDDIRNEEATTRSLALESLI